MGADNVFVNFSGATIDSGSRTVQLTVLCGISGGLVIPVAVNGAGELITA